MWDWWLQCFRLDVIGYVFKNPFFCQSPYLEEVQQLTLWILWNSGSRRQQLYITQFWPWPLKTELDASFQLKNSINPHIQDGRIGSHKLGLNLKTVQLFGIPLTSLLDNAPKYLGSWLHYPKENNFCFLNTVKVLWIY